MEFLFITKKGFKEHVNLMENEPRNYKILEGHALQEQKNQIIKKILRKQS